MEAIAAGVRGIVQLLAPSAERSDAEPASWSLSAEPSSVPRARRLTRAQLTAWRLKDLGDSVELLVSELVTNALRHAPGPCRLTLWNTDGLLRCEVEDTGAALPYMRHGRARDEGGRGLHLLAAIACCWGSARTSTGKVTWFELPTGERA